MAAGTPNDLSPIEAEALHAVATSVALLRRAAERTLASHGGLTRTQFELLRRLAGAPEGLRMFELADQLVLSRSTLTYHVAQLAEEGLVVREGGTSTQRAVRARITTAGRDLLGELKHAHTAVMKEHFIDSFSPEELATVAEGFTRVVRSFGEQVPTALPDEVPRLDHAST